MSETNNFWASLQSNSVVAKSYIVVSLILHTMRHSSDANRFTAHHFSSFGITPQCFYLLPKSRKSFVVRTVYRHKAAANRSSQEVAYTFLEGQKIID